MNTWNVLRIEGIKVVRRPMTWVLAGVMALLVIVIYTSLYMAVTGQETSETLPPEAVEALRETLYWPQALFGLLSFSAGNGLGGLLLVIVAGATVAQEYSWRTAHLWLARGLPRPAFLLGKFAALALVALAFALIPLLVGGPLTAWFTYRSTGTIPLESVRIPWVALALLRTAYTALPYLALTLLLAVLTRSVAASVGIGLAYSLLLEGFILRLLTLIGGRVAQVGKFLPASMAAALTSLDRGGMEAPAAIGTPLLEPWAAALGIAALTTVLLVTALGIFRQQDLPEQA